MIIRNSKGMVRVGCASCLWVNPLKLMWLLRPFFLLEIMVFISLYCYALISRSNSLTFGLFFVWVWSNLWGACGFCVGSYFVSFHHMPRPANGVAQGLAYWSRDNMVTCPYTYRIRHQQMQQIHSMIQTVARH